MQCEMRDDFHPLVREWFDSSFSAATEPQLQGWPAIRAGAGRADLRSDRLGKDACGLHALLGRPRPPRDRGHAPRSDARRLRLAAQSADQRRPREPGEAARGVDRPRRRSGLPMAPIRTAVRTGDTTAAAAPEHAAQAAARARHDARVALYLADGREVARALRRRYHRDRRRDSCDGRRQARLASGAHARAPRSSGRTGGGRNRSASGFRRPCVRWSASRSS